MQSPMQSPNVGPGGELFGNRDKYVLRVTYEIPPTRAVKTAEFEEFGAPTSTIESMVKEENPSWRILKIERGIKQ